MDEATRQKPAARLAAITAEMASAARIARRKPEDIALIAVSKTREADAITPLIAAGQRRFGDKGLTVAADDRPSKPGW